ncbi:MAG: hypothetical protein ACTS22_00925 [Phycisphaerales bacterium]
MTPAPADQQTATPARPLAWGAFLGASWTWCIGMYLPILLVRDLGLAGYLVFAIPNVLGAAAMGWVLRSPQASRQLVNNHSTACAWFGVVTIGYHLFWLAWLGVWAITSLPNPVWTAAGLAGVACVLAVLAPAVRRDGPARLTALAVMLISLAAMVTFLLAPSPAEPTIENRLRSIGMVNDALWMAPVSVLGFLLCPYLDPTFHRARQACDTPAGGRIAFGFGFGVCFALMIVFTLLYAGPIVGFVDGSGGEGVAIPTTVAVLLGLHIAFQWAFTVAVHNRERRADPVRLPLAPWFLVGSLALGAGLALLAGHRTLGMAPGEIGYRAFLSFYGLVFPAYAWLNMIDLPRLGLRRPTPRSLLITWAAIVLASPFYFVGFMLRDEPWLAVGVGIIILMKFLSDDRADEARPALSP